ncbi:MAG: hypothetical protein AB1349_11055 [Elusimicrobiota bacterium]
MFEPIVFFSLNNFHGKLRRLTRRAVKILWESQGLNLHQGLPLNALRLELFEEKLKKYKPTTRRTYRYLVNKFLEGTNSLAKIVCAKKAVVLKRKPEILKEWQSIRKKSGNRKVYISFLKGWAVRAGLSPTEITIEKLKEYLSVVGPKTSVGYMVRIWNELYEKGIVPVKLPDMPKKVKKPISIPRNELPEKLLNDWENYKKFVVSSKGSRVGNHKVNEQTFKEREKCFLEYIYFLKYKYKPRINIEKYNLREIFQINKKNRLFIKKFIKYRSETVKPISIVRYLGNFFIPVISYYFGMDVSDIKQMVLKWKKKYKPHIMPAVYQQKISNINFQFLEKLPEFLLQARKKIVKKFGYKYARLTMLALLFGLILEIPLRARTLSVLQIGKNIVFEGNGWKVYLYPEDVKHAKEDDFWEFDFPSHLVPLLEEYINLRQVLVKDKQHKHLFVSAAGEKLSSHYISQLTNY